MHHILIIEDEEFQSKKIAGISSELGHQSTIVHNYEEAMGVLSRDIHFDLILLDLQLKGSLYNGLVICQKVCAIHGHPPIIMLTKVGGEENMIKGLEMGASDYITKPYSDDLLRARINAALRTVQNARPVQQKKLKIDERLEIDLEKRRVYLDGNEIGLSHRELDLLLFLANHPDKTFSRSELIKEVWGSPNGYIEGTVTRHIASLRKELDDPANNPRYIFTVDGGYRFRKR